MPVPERERCAGLQTAHCGDSDVAQSMDNRGLQGMRAVRGKRTKETSAMQPDNEIRTLTLRFNSKATANRFAAVCAQFGHAPAHGRDAVWHTVTAVFQNKAARSRVVSAWARESMVVAE